MAVPGVTVILVLLFLILLGFVMLGMLGWIAYKTIKLIVDNAKKK